MMSASSTSRIMLAAVGAPASVRASASEPPLAPFETPALSNEDERPRDTVGSGSSPPELQPTANATTRGRAIFGERMLYFPYNRRAMVGRLGFRGVAQSGASVFEQVRQESAVPSLRTRDKRPLVR